MELLYIYFSLSGNNYVVYVYCVKDESDENERLGSCIGRLEHCVEQGRFRVYLM